ncbi:membrane-targeted effector domain-containing toxin [Pseudomonas sp.]|uniref:membrane-targeted effector domain-containing toxin n=1 Tax=Pseudomonas sp. TaxID=306 RepID=UPI003D701B46
MTISFSRSASLTYPLPSLDPVKTQQPAPQSRVTRSPPNAPSPDGRLALNTALGDRRDLQKLVHALRTVVKTLPENAEAAAVLAALKETHVAIDPHSSLRREQTFTQHDVSLDTFLQAKGIRPPTSVADLQTLADTFADHSLTHPLGNFGGALSWALPLSVANQRKVFDVVACNSANLEGLPLQTPRLGALDYLTSAVSLSASDIQAPDKALEKLLDTSRSQALGEAIQRDIQGIATQSSINDYVLAAIHLGLEPESIESPKRNNVAGFNLAAHAYFGKSPADVIEALTDHLRNSGRTSSDNAELGARLLLARVAPQFLVKDIPAGVDMGSQAWTNLCLAVSRIEAETPGKSALMSFGEVMLAADEMPPVSESTQKALLIDWAIANQVVDEHMDETYSNEDVELARVAFNQQQSDLKTASEMLETPMPNRKAMALALLKKTFGDGIDFEHKALRINYGSETPGPRFSDPYSMLDITMQGLKLNDSWQVFANNTLDLQAFTAFTQRPEFNIPATFDKAFSEVTKHYKDIKQHLMMNAITHLPLEDRTQLNYGKLRFFKENSYKTSLIPFVDDSLFHSSTTIQVQAEHNGQTRSYAFDTEKGTIKKILTRPADRKPEYVSNEVNKIEEFFPDANALALQEYRTIYHRPNHFQNPRIQQVAATVVKGLGIDSAAVRRQAEGRTPAEQRSDTLSSMGEFLLDLIPLRSAIVNLSNGNYKDAAVDLALDVFGFVTAGLGMAGKLAKVTGKTSNALTKVVQGSRIIGATAVNAFNPLGGLGDLAVGAGKLAVQSTNAVSTGIQRLRGMGNGADLAYASSRFDAAATGVLKVGDQTVVGSAVKHNDHWYAFDADRLQPYGPPLEGFNPTDTLMPHPLKTYTHTPQRVQPYVVRPPHPHVGAIKAPLPAGDYVENTMGKLVPGHFIPGNGMEQTKAYFTQQMENYHNTIKAGGALPAPPTLPALPKQIPPQDLITEALKVSQGLVFGESHSQMASFKLLMANMQTFKTQGVKKVYFEGVIDLPPFGAVDDGISSLGSTKNGRSNPTFKQLRDEFRKNGIEVLPLDHYYLTRHKDERPLRSRTIQGVNSDIRLKEFNYFAAETIQSNSGTEKWIALVGNAHMNTSEGVTGLAELTGAVGIGVFDNKNVPASVGFRDTRHVPDPNQPLKRTDLPGNLHIYMKP